MPKKIQTTTFVRSAPIPLESFQLKMQLELPLVNRQNYRAQKSASSQNYDFFYRNYLR